MWVFSLKHYQALKKTGDDKKAKRKQEKNTRLMFSWSNGVRCRLLSHSSGWDRAGDAIADSKEDETEADAGRVWRFKDDIGRSARSVPITWVFNVPSLRRELLGF